jgi:sensor histidine kinase YesM
MFGFQYQQNEDYLIQRRLLVLMTVFELLITLVAIAFLYYRIEDIIESRIYRFHNSGMSVLEEYWLTIALILSAIIACNLVVIAVAHFVWVRYVNTVITRLGKNLEKIARLDFSTTESGADAIHPVLEDLNSWVEAERRLNSEIHRSLAEVRSEDDPAKMLVWARRMTARLSIADSRSLASNSQDATS